eukprot:1708130-Pyramimonas_sp.AAC.1
MKYTCSAARARGGVACCDVSMASLWARQAVRLSRLLPPSLQTCTRQALSWHGTVLSPVSDGQCQEGRVVGCFVTESWGCALTGRQARPGTRKRP